MVHRHPIIVACIAALALSLQGCHRRQAADSLSTAEIIDRAGVVQIVLDISRSSPALDPAFMAGVAPQIAEKIKGLPPGTIVSVTTVGDATMTTSLLRMQVQARGTTANEIARKLERYLADFPAQAKGKEQGRSDLVGGFAAAAGMINRKSDANLIFYVSDLAEYSAVAQCTQSLKCKLPSKPSFDLSGVQVHVYGVGQGMPSDRAMQLTEDWRQFLAKANVKNPELRRL